MSKQEIETGTVRPDASGTFPVVEGLRSVALGNGSQFEVSVSKCSDSAGRVIGVLGHGCYVFRSWVHWTYAKQKLNLLDGDALNMADFINCQLNGNPGDVQGRYNPPLCDGEPVAAKPKLVQIQVKNGAVLRQPENNPDFAIEISLCCNTPRFDYLCQSAFDAIVDDARIILAETLRDSKVLQEHDAEDDVSRRKAERLKQVQAEIRERASDMLARRIATAPATEAGL
jgi:hypothetical protein